MLWIWLSHQHGELIAQLMTLAALSINMSTYVVAVREESKSSQSVWVWVGKVFKAIKSVQDAVEKLGIHCYSYDRLRKGLSAKHRPASLGDSRSKHCALWIDIVAVGGVVVKIPALKRLQDLMVRVQSLTGRESTFLHFSTGFRSTKQNKDVRLIWEKKREQWYRAFFKIENVNFWTDGEWHCFV